MGPAARQLPHLGNALQANGGSGHHFTPWSCTVHGIICKHTRIVWLLPFRQVCNALRGTCHGGAVQCH